MTYIAPLKDWDRDQAQLLLPGPQPLLIEPMYSGQSFLPSELLTWKKHMEPIDFNQESFNMQPRSIMHF